MPEQHPEREDLVKRLCARFDACDQGIHRKLRERWDEFDRLYHNYRDFKDAVGEPRDADVGSVRREAAEAFGHPLFIPMTFSTVESTVARLMANPPHPVVLPARSSTQPESGQTMGYLIAQQQERAKLALKFQMIEKEALRLGLGVGKSRWQHLELDVPRVRPSVGGEGKYALSTEKETVFHGPLVDYVNVRDFFWDPLAIDVDSARYLIHRIWRDDEYCMEKFASGEWTVTDRAGNEVSLSLEDVKSTGGAQRFTESRNGGRAAQRLDGTFDQAKLGDLRELWECHDGKTVTLVLGRRWIVKQFGNPTPKTPQPFITSRPTDIGEFYGKGVIEPIVDLQHELNDARTDRRWNALFALHKFFFYDDTALDPDDVSIFPGAMIPTRGNPNEMIQEGTVRDIPGSAREETEDLKSDIYNASGLTDPSDATAAPETATGVQLVQAATQHRVNLMVKRAELEMAVPVGDHWIQLNQRENLGNVDVRKPLAAPDPNMPDRTHEMVSVSPGELQGDFDFTVVGNSMAAENIPQQRQDAQTLIGLLGNPMFASQALAAEVVRKLGYPNPQAYLAPQAPPVPPALVGKLVPILGQDKVNALLAAAQAEEDASRA